LNLLTNLLKNYQIILASQSPRRIHLLKSLGLDFEIIPANIDENILNEIEPSLYCKELALAKARIVSNNCIRFSSCHTELVSVSHQETLKQVQGDSSKNNSSKSKSKSKNNLIIAADTIVVLDGEIINKPKDAEDAFSILRKLSGNRHIVYTGVAVLNLANSKEIIDYSSTVVYFRELSDGEILDYICTGSPMDKAGGYGIQDDYGALFVRRIEGCYNNVIGLPLELMFQMLMEVI